ncbi:MAG: PIG-L family deacetylase [Lewinellaceae bacterium]|nr:PIG-L family deacetylase [Lewinellaceae bacterium]
MKGEMRKPVALIVAHPDDETLWAGGTILSHPSWQCFMVCACRGNDTDRAPKFYDALKVLKSEGAMGCLDDGPDQRPLDEAVVEGVILDLLPPRHFGLVITHNPSGEYTRHLRHEEVSRAVIQLWHAGKISTDELWTFAYEDGGREYLPKPVENAAIYQKISKQDWLKKYSLITEIYGFEKTSFEAETTPRAEAFWQFSNSNDAMKWLSNGGVLT